jgi:hypothetical protein
MRWRGTLIYLIPFGALLLANDGFNKPSDRTLMEFAALALVIAGGQIWELYTRSTGAPEVLERFGKGFDRLESRLSEIESQMRTIKADCDALRDASKKAALHAWEERHKDQMAVLAPAMTSPDVTISGPAIARWIELLKDDPP